MSAAKIRALEKKLARQEDELRTLRSKNGASDPGFVLQQFNASLCDLKGFIYRCKNDDSFSSLFISDSVSEVIGYSSSDFINSTSVNYASFIHPEDLPIVRKRVEDMANNDSKLYLEYRVVTKQGQVKWVEEFCVGIKDLNGQIIEFEGVVTDITVYKETDISLKVSNERFRKIFELSPAAIILTDFETGKILEANEAFERITGWPKADYTGKTKADLNVWLNAEDRIGFMQELGKSGRVENREFKHLTRDGQMRDVLISAHLLEGKGAAQALTVLTDITTQKQKEIELNRSSAIYAHLVEDIDEIVYELDQQRNFVYLSPRFETVTGLKVTDFIGKHMLEIFHPDDKQESEMKAAQLSDGTDTRPVVFRVINKHNEIIWLQASRSFIYENGAIIGARGTATNITQQKETELALVKAKETAETADRLKSAFLAIMSHELRTPLNAIIGFSGLIDESLAKSEIIEMNEVIKQSANQLLDIIESIIELAFLQSKQKAVKCEHFTPESLRMELKSFTLRQLKRAEKDQLTVSILEDGPVDLEMKTDKGKIVQVLKNLLSNAVKYSAVGEIKLGIQVEGDNVIFAVSDQGIGIHPEKHELIFERFRQVDEANTREYGGIGVGLAICKEIAALLGGKIWVQSALNYGTTFYLKIPGAIC